MFWLPSSFSSSTTAATEPSIEQARRTRPSLLQARSRMLLSNTSWITNSGLLRLVSQTDMLRSRDPMARHTNWAFLLPGPSSSFSKMLSLNLTQVTAFL